MVSLAGRMGGDCRQGNLTGVSVLKGRLAGIEGGVDGWQKAAVEGFGAVQESGVLRGGEVVVRADLGVGAVAGTLQPGGVLTACAGGDGLDGDELVSIQRRRHDGAIAECLRTEGGTDGRIEALQKGLGGRHEDVVEGGGCSDLG